MTAIGPGDWVECVAIVAPEEGGVRAGFVVGELYCVIEVINHSDGVPGLEFSNAPPSGVGGWHSEYFRPIYRPKADLIESLKTPAKRERAPVNA